MASLASRLASAALAAVLLAAAGCAATPADPDATDERNPMRGEIARLVADRADGTSETIYYLRTDGGAEPRLIFGRDPGLPSHARVLVWGRRAGDAMAVAGYRADESASPAPQSGALTGANPGSPRRFAFVLIDTGAGVNLSVEEARARMFATDSAAPGQGSIRRYYQEASYGVADITGDVFGPLAYTPTAPCDTRGVTSLRGQVDHLAGGPSDHYLWYFGSRQSQCNFAGLAAEGSPSRPARDTWYNAASGCVVLVQEPGHNFGMQHSSSMTCAGGQPFVDVPDGACTHSEYGDAYDPMGSACRHMNGWQKAFEGWLLGCNVVKVNSTGTYTLHALETPCNGFQVLQVPMPRTRPFTHAGGGGPVTTDVLTSYYLELRTPVGFDENVGPTVLVRVAGDLRGKTRNGLHTWLLDMTPATASFRDAGLGVGQKFTDPAGGLSFTVLAAGATQASIQIEMDHGAGAPTCLDGTLASAPGPERCDDPPLATGGIPSSGPAVATGLPFLDGGTVGPGGGGPVTPPRVAGGSGCGCAVRGGGARGADGGGAAAALAAAAVVLAAFRARRRAAGPRRRCRSGSARADGA
jgi:hypothetical protein